MHLFELLIQKNQLSGRRHIAPLGYVVIAITLVFVGAVFLGWYRLITRNVNALDLNPSVTLAESVEAAPPVLQNQTNANSAVPQWAIKIIQTPLGENVVELPPEVTEAVLRDFDAAQKDWDEHKFDLTYLEKRAPEYFVGKQLDSIRSMLKWLKQGNRTVEMGGYKLLPVGRSVQFAPSGMQGYVVEYIAASNAYEYDLKTKKRVDEQFLEDRIVMTEVSYDVSAKRWKISRFALLMDLKTKNILWEDR